MIRETIRYVSDMTRKYDVIVVGAGPSGTTAARLSAKSGLSTLLIEEQAHIGYPVQCAGLLSNSAFEECDVSRSAVLNEVSGADVIAGSSVCSFNAGKRMAYVVDRARLDLEMAAKAADAGSDIQLKTIGTGLSIKNRTLTTKGMRGTEDIEYSLLIAADGPRSTISRSLKIPRAPIYLSGLQCDVCLETDPDNVQIFPNASPEFFGWKIPIDEKRSRVGLCGVTNVHEKFSSFINPYKHQSIHFVSGTIPLGLIGRTYDDGVMIVGDAAAIAKPTSGGGVYTGIRSARHAISTAIMAINEGRTDSKSLQRYERKWQNDFGRELQKGFTFFKLRQKISPDKIEKIIKIMSDPAICDVIIKKGDMDRPSSLLNALILHPHMIPALMQVGRSLLSSGDSK